MAVIYYLVFKMTVQLEEIHSTLTKKLSELDT